MTEESGSFSPPEVTNLGIFAGAALRADTEQQQQQQQQQQASRAVRRFLNEDTQLPQEEIVNKLTTEVKQINTLSPRKR